MSKGSGGTRGGASKYTIAERLYASGQLTVDPDDAIYAPIKYLPKREIADSISNSTDFDVVGVKRTGNTLTLSLIYKHDDAGKADVVEYEPKEATLMGVIQEISKRDNYNYLKRKSTEK